MPDFNQGTARARIDPSWEGEDVELPNGQPIPDPSSPTNNLKSPLADLRPVAAAGRETGSTFRQMLADPHSAESAGGVFGRRLARTPRARRHIRLSERRQITVGPARQQDIHAATELQERLEFQRRLVPPASGHPPRSSANDCRNLRSVALEQLQTGPTVRPGLGHATLYGTRLPDWRERRLR
jgi:hypothetical protein